MISGEDTNVLKCDALDCYCRDENGNCCLTCVTIGKDGQCNEYELFKKKENWKNL